MEYTYLCVLLALAVFTADVHCTDDIVMEPAKSHFFLEMDQTQKLKCSTRAAQGLKLTWMSDSKLALDSSEGFKVTGTVQDEVKRELVELDILKYNPKMQGLYRCQSRNTSDDNRLMYEYTVTLHTVNREREDVMFYRENNTITLSCKIDSNGATVKEVVWKKVDTLIEDVVTDESTFEVSGENLTIKDVRRSDAAMYTAEYVLDVNGNTFTQDCEVALKATPLVLDFDKSKNLIQDDNLELQCKTLGYPAPTVTWFKDNVEVDSSVDRVSMEELKGVVNGTLKISKVGYEDAGNYKCTATTKELSANDSKTITVRVKDKYAALWPFIGIVCEVIVLCTIIFIYEKHRSRQAEREEAAHEEPNGTAADRSEGLRHRNTTNPRA